MLSKSAIPGMWCMSDVCLACWFLGPLAAAPVSLRRVVANASTQYENPMRHFG